MVVERFRDASEASISASDTASAFCYMVHIVEPAQ
jgi:hypothetical protein